MRSALLVGALLVPVAAFGRTSVRVGGGSTLPGHGGFTRGGLSFKYGRSTPHSDLSIRYGSGARSWHGGHSAWGGAGSTGTWSTRGYPGVHVYRGWSPYSPDWHARQAVGPFTYTDAVVFHGVGGAAVFGYRQRVQGAGAAMEGTAWRARAAASGYAALPAQRIIDRGDELFVRGSFAEAAVAYRAAAAKAPDNPMASLALGHGLFATGHYAEGAAALRRAVQLHPELLHVRMNRRHFYGDPAAFDAQLARLERHVTQAPADKAARFVLGYNCFFTQQYGKAGGHFAALGDGDREARLFLREIARRK